LYLVWKAINMIVKEYTPDPENSHKPRINDCINDCIVDFLFD